MRPRSGAGLALAVAYAAFSGWGIPAQRTCAMLFLFGGLRWLGVRWPWPLVCLLSAAAVLALLASDIPGVDEEVRSRNSLEISASGGIRPMVRLLRDRPGALILSGDAHRNAVYDDSGVIEIVSSAVARRSLVFKVLRSNYGILSFDDDGLRVQLHSLKVSSRFDFRIERSHWTLP
jgi:hypothetical protein